MELINMNSELNHIDLNFHLIVESAPTSFVIVDKEGSIIYINRQSEKLFGYNRNELVGQNIDRLIPEEFKKKHPRYRSDFFKSPQTRAMGAGRELFALRKNRSQFPVEIGLNPIETEKGMVVLAAIIDISERKKVEESFRLVVESAPNAMVLINKEGKIKLINTQTEILFGYRRDELVNQKIEVLIPPRFIQKHPDFRKMFYKNPEVRSMGKGRELFGLRKDGTEIPLEIGLNPIETSDGLMVLASIIDITERKQRQETERKKLELEIRNIELEQFAYIASHDLQEPLRTVTNYIQVIKEDYSEILPEDTIQYLDHINDATNRMRLLVRSLLDFSKLGKNSELKWVDVNEILEYIKSDLFTIIQQTGTRLEFKKMPKIFGRETELRQLFQNLISNGIKFSRVEAIPEIKVQCKRVLNGWIFTIVDNGIGIDEKYYGRIFQIFQRLHPTNKYEGNGLGLAYCKKIVDLHGGEIWVTSEINKGSKFSFTISEKIK